MDNTEATLETRLSIEQALRDLKNAQANIGDAIARLQNGNTNSTHVIRGAIQSCTFAIESVATAAVLQRVSKETP